MRQDNATSYKFNKNKLYNSCLQLPHKTYKIIMNRKLCYFLLLAVATGSITTSTYAQPKLNKGNVKEVVAAMTPDEKAHLVVGMGMRFGPPAARKDSGQAPANTASQGPVIGTTEDKVPGAAGTIYAIPRLGIPSIVMADGPAGLRSNPIRNHYSYRTYYTTAWPVTTLLASGWDTALAKRVGTAFGYEVKEYGVKDIIVEKVNKVLVPQESINETKPITATSSSYIEELNGFIGMGM